MKKIFQIGLLMLLFIVALAVVPTKTAGPNYQDSQIQYVMTADQPLMAIMLDQEIENCYPYGIALRPGDVEKSPFSEFTLIVATISGKTSLAISYDNASSQKANTVEAVLTIRDEGLTRLDIGENSTKRV